MRDPQRIAAGLAPLVEGLADALHEGARALAAAAGARIGEVARPGVELGAIDGSTKRGLPRRRDPSRRCAHRCGPRDRAEARRAPAPGRRSAARASRRSPRLPRAAARCVRPACASPRAAPPRRCGRSTGRPPRWSAHGAQGRASCLPGERQVDRELADLLRRAEPVAGEALQPAPQQRGHVQRAEQARRARLAAPCSGGCASSSSAAAGSAYSTPTSKAPPPIASASGLALLAP